MHAGYHPFSAPSAPSSDYFSSFLTSSPTVSSSPAYHRLHSSLAASVWKPLQFVEVETTKGTRMLHIRQLQISQIKSDIDHEVVVKRKDSTYAKGHLKYVGIPTGMKETGTIMAGITLDLPSKKLSTYMVYCMHLYVPQNMAHMILLN